MNWMAWTGPTAVFFFAIVVILAGMAILEIHWPSVERKGFLPLVTTRGDRLFFGLVVVAFLNLLAVALFDSILFPFVFSIGIFATIFFKG